MKNIVIASHNKHKIKEIKQILKEYSILSLTDIGYFDEIEETGNSFLENALIKAKTIHQYLQQKNILADVISDDSGLCVSALSGAPGIYSARYGSDHTDKSNRERLLNELKSIKDRSAYFICVIVEYHPDGSYLYTEGKTDGYILEKEEGNDEFGYDCIFYSNELNKSFGMATEEEKNSISHRYKALNNLLKIKNN